MLDMDFSARKTNDNNNNDNSDNTETPPHLFLADLATSDIASSSAPVCFTPHFPAKMAPTSLADPCSTLHSSMYCTAPGGEGRATGTNERRSRRGHVWRKRQRTMTTAAVRAKLKFFNLSRCSLRHSLHEEPSFSPPIQSFKRPKSHPGIRVPQQTSTHRAHLSRGVVNSIVVGWTQKRDRKYSRYSEGKQTEPSGIAAPANPPASRRPRTTPRSTRRTSCSRLPRSAASPTCRQAPPGMYVAF